VLRRWVSGARRPEHELRRSVLIALAVAVAYVAVSQYVIWLNDPVGAGAGFWPAAGITLAALLAIPTRHWWTVAAAAFVAELLGDLAHGYPLFASTCWATANALEPVVGAALVRRFASHDGRLASVRAVAVLVLGAAVAAPALSGLVGGLGTTTSFDAAWTQVWPKWVAGDGLGVLVMAPPLLAWRTARTRRPVWERVALTGLVVAATSVAFRNWDHAYDAVLPYVTLPPMIWAAVRFGPRGAALSACLTAHGANLATAFGYGPFALRPGAESHAVTLLQVFLAITITTTLTLAALAADLTERAEVERLLAHEASHDHLTGLPNRLELNRRLEAAVRGASPARAVAVMFLDLDRFKVVNDSLGHEWGDALLVEVAERLRGAARPTDLVVRLGGDEFVVVCPDLDDAAEARKIARRLLDAVAEPIRHDGTTFSVSASIGVAVVTDPTTSSSVVLRNADTAMYRAKRTGRARVAFFDQALHESARRRLGIEMELRAALDRDELVVHYQPILDATERSVVAVEALVRWQHPERGLLGPGEFLDVAEDCGLMGALGDVVVTRALTDVSSSADHRLAVSLNVSAAQLQDRGDGDTAQHVLATCRRLGLDPRRVWVELTESALLDGDTAVDALLGMQQAGVRLALDDFGTGYASLSQLERIAFDLVKVDRSFVAGLRPGRDQSFRRVEAIVALVHSFGMQCVAEGVETAVQEDALRRFGCDLLQGYRLARPALWRDPGTGRPPVPRQRPAQQGLLAAPRE